MNFDDKEDIFLKIDSERRCELEARYKRLIDLADKRHDEHLSELEKKHG